MHPSPFPSQNIDALFGEILPVKVGVQPNVTDFVFTVANGYYMRLLSMQYGLACDGTVANRFPGYAINDPDGFSYYIARTTNAVTAGLTITMSTSPWCQLNNGTTAQLTYALPFPQIWLPPGARIKTSVPSMVGTDHLTFVNMWLECLGRDIVERYYSREDEDELYESRIGEPAPLSTYGR